MARDKGLALLMIYRKKKSENLTLKQLLNFYKNTKTFLFFREDCIELLEEMISEQNKKINMEKTQCK